MEFEIRKYHITDLSSLYKICLLTANNGDDASSLLDDPDLVGWYQENSGETSRPISLKEPNVWGLHDMSGNVWEWVQDDYAQYSGEQTDPISTDNPDSKVVRGGRWAFWARAIRSAERGTYSPDNQRNELGFRLARSAN